MEYIGRVPGTRFEHIQYIYIYIQYIPSLVTSKDMTKSPGIHLLIHRKFWSKILGPNPPNFEAPKPPLAVRSSLAVWCWIKLECPASCGLCLSYLSLIVVGFSEKTTIEFSEIIHAFKISMLFLFFVCVWSWFKWWNLWFGAKTNTEIGWLLHHSRKHHASRPVAVVLSSLHLDWAIGISIPGWLTKRTLR